MKAVKMDLKKIYILYKGYIVRREKTLSKLPVGLMGNACIACRQTAAIMHK
jgi:hypothetical protein